MERMLPRRAFFTVNAPVADREKLRCFAMAAALLGVPLRKRNDFVITRRVESGARVDMIAWNFNLKSRDGQYKAALLWKWWNDPEWLAANPTHPLAIYREFAQALEDAAAHEATAIPLAVFSHGRRYAHIPINCKPERKEKLLALLRS
jgi:hypothetical protein